MVEAINLPIEIFQTALLQIDRIRAAEILENIYLRASGYDLIDLGQELSVGYE